MYLQYTIQRAFCFNRQIQKITMLMKDYTENLAAELRRMGFDYHVLRTTQNFTGSHTCYQYHIEFKEQCTTAQLPENIGFTFLIQYPDDADFFINTITVDFVSKNQAKTAYRSFYFKTKTGFPTKQQMIERLLARKLDMDKENTYQ